MALSNKQIEQASLLIKLGELSNRAIAKEVGCSESAIRVLAKKYGVEKNAINTLAEQEVVNTIIGNEIKTQKTQLNNAERKAYDKAFFTLSESVNLFTDATIDNQLLTNQAQDYIKQKALDNPELILDYLPNLMAIGKMTETNRKSILGLTEPYKPPTVEDETIGNTTVVYQEDVKGLE